MPLLFLGHGSPMNAIEENEFTKGFRESSAGILRPSAILCISAHWETSGTKVTAMEAPRTIHDFGGFPRELYEVQYPAPGDPGLAAELSGMSSLAQITLDHDWGLDHGAWSVIRHLYPDAGVPVVQLSLDIKLARRRGRDLLEEMSVDIERRIVRATAKRDQLKAQLERMRRSE